MVKISKKLIKFLGFIGKLILIIFDIIEFIGKVIDNFCLIIEKEFDCCYEKK